MNVVPAEVFPPGDFLRDELEVRDWSQVEFAEIIGRPTRLVNEIIAGKRGITPETASELAAALGTSAQFWMNLETSYQLSKVPPVSDRIGREADLREKFPVRDLIKRGWIEKSNNYEVLEAQVLKFYELSSINDRIEFAHAAKRQRRSAPTTSQVAWLARVKQLANTVQLENYSRTKLEGILPSLEECTLEPESARHVPRLLNECGVVFLIVEPMQGSKIDGACMWINKSRRPVVGLTLRHNRIDNFWFVLRHEIEHVLQGHGKDSPILDELDEPNSEDPKSVEEERVANAAASDFCTPTDQLEKFINRLHPIYPHKQLLGFAKILERHPGLVAGQLRNRTGRYDLFAKYLVKIREHVVPSALTDGYGEELPFDL